MEEGGKNKRKGVKSAGEAFYSEGLRGRAAVQKAPCEESAEGSGREGLRGWAWINTSARGFWALRVTFGMYHGGKFPL